MTKAHAHLPREAIVRVCFRVDSNDSARSAEARERAYSGLEDNRIVGHIVGERRFTVNFFFSADTMGYEASSHRTVPMWNMQAHQTCSMTRIVATDAIKPWWYK